METRYGVGLDELRYGKGQAMGTEWHRCGEREDVADAQAEDLDRRRTAEEALYDALVGTDRSEIVYPESSDTARSTRG